VLLANATCIAVKQGSSVAPGEPWFPGKTVFTEGNPKDELFPFQLGGGVYPGLDRLREQYKYTGRERSGVSDLNSGNINACRAAHRPRPCRACSKRGPAGRI
jgi:hypothetical protein